MNPNLTIGKFLVRFNLRKLLPDPAYCGLRRFLDERGWQPIEAEPGLIAGFIEAEEEHDGARKALRA